MMTFLDVLAHLEALQMHKIKLGLEAMESFLARVDHPERKLAFVHVAGTNGKGSVCSALAEILTLAGYRVGVYTSPHLSSVRERFRIGRDYIDESTFAALGERICAVLGEEKITYFEFTTALGLLWFAESEVDVVMFETGMGGRLDATNVVTPLLSVITSVSMDHEAYLGNTLAEIAAEKAGIIKAGSRAVLAAQSPEAARVLLARCAEVGVEVRREGIEFGLIDRTPAVGGQVLRLETADGPLGDVVLPLYGAHMAQNAALALAAVEAFLGGRALPADAVADGFAAVKAPARLELVRTSPSVLLDTCHNPHGARATMAAVEEAFAFEPLIGIVAMMADKDVNAVLGVFAEAMSTVVCTTIAGTPRAMPAAELATRAGDVFGPHRVLMAENLEDAIEQAVTLADQSGPTAGILIAGSVYAAGQARSLLVHPDED